MAQVLPVDLDYLAARLHGRRGHMAEGDRLDVLCRLRTLPELVRAVAPQSGATTAREFQQELILGMAAELADFAYQLTGSGSALMAWLRVRLQMENLKVLARAFATGKSSAVAREYLVPLPDDLSLDWRALAEADSLETFIAAMPAGILREGLTAATATFEQEPRPIVLEAALDRAYFAELLTRTQSLPSAARDDVLPIARQEVDTFHVMLVARGRFTYGLTAERLAWLHVPGTGISRDLFDRMLEADTLWKATQQAVGFVVSAWPVVGSWREADSASFDSAMLDVLAWNQYHRLAQRAFRRSHMGLGAVVAFAALRRIEVANLITLSEGIRTDMPSDAIRARLIPSEMEIHRV